MRKFIVIGVLVLVALAGVVSAIAAQDTTETTAQAWLGVAVAENDGQVLIARVMPGSPADAADLLIGDVVESFNGTAVEAASDLGELVQAAAPGDAVTLDVLRNGEAVSIDVTLGTLPTFGPGNRRGFNMPQDALTIAEMLLRADLEETDDGFEVVSVDARFNPFILEEGDVVTTLNGQAIAELSLETLATALAASEEPTLSLTVVRDGEEVNLESDMFLGGRRGFGFEGGRGGRGGHPGRGFGAPALPEAPAEVTPEASADV